MTKAIEEAACALTLELFLNDPLSGEKQMFLQILDNIEESLLIVDKESRICFVNKSYEKLFSISRDRIVGRYLKKFEPLARIHEAIRLKQHIVGDITHIYSANLDVYADIVPLLGGDEVIGAVACMKNVTEITRANNELKHFKELTAYLKDEIERKEDLPLPMRSITGHSMTFVNVLRVASKAAPTDASICITGESGTGKEVIASAIHYSSLRAAKPFIKINCAAIPETLLESELFGYEQGAFTGAKTGGKAGKFEMANGGTVFMDEIGDMPLAMQVKILRVLQEHEVERVGGNKKIKLDFRLITATNKDLFELIEQGSFREDLYYRLNVIPINLPPLRERREDIMMLANTFLNEFCIRYDRQLSFSDEVIDIFSNYSWPGNIRELRNCVERAAILASNAVITAEQIPVKLSKTAGNGAKSGADEYNLPEIVSNVERDVILSAIKQCGGNKTKAIESLGISRRAFYQKLEKYGIK